MLQFVGTPEEWFRVHQRDLHVVRYRWPRERFLPRKKNAKLEKCLRRNPEVYALFEQSRTERNAWFARNLPDTPVNMIGMSEYAGWALAGPRCFDVDPVIQASEFDDVILGEPCYFAVDFDQTGVAMFADTWGQDSPWYIETWSLAHWRNRIDAVQLLSAPVATLQTLRWWDTPRGFLLLGSGEKDCVLSMGDAVRKLDELFPECAGHSFDKKYPCGSFSYSATDDLESMIYVECTYGRRRDWDCDEYTNNPANMKRLREVIGIKNSMPIRIIVGDF